jgi:hypothetical protein
VETTPNIDGTTSPQLEKLMKIEGEKGQIYVHKLNILCNWHATSKSDLKLQQMPPQPPAAEVTLQCAGS